MAPRTIVTIAGAGYSDGFPAKEADVGWSTGVDRRPNGDLVFGDIRSHRLWRIDKDGILHTFAGDGVPGNSGDGGPARDRTTRKAISYQSIAGMGFSFLQF